MKRTLSTLAFGLLTAASGSLAVAQTTTPTKDHPTAIGTSQQTADEANQKAIQNGSTATVVRTGPTAAERVKGAASSAGDKANDMKAKAKTKSKAATTDDDTTSTGTTRAKP